MKQITTLCLALWLGLTSIQANTLDFPEEYTGADLRYIGMPVGGLTTGQVYLSGDGELWYWDIFNIQRIKPGGPGDKFYLNPMVPHKTFEQGFAVRVLNKNKNFLSATKQLNKNDFQNVSFRGEYPVGKVSYKDDNFPVSVLLEAYTPFVPTDIESSDFPAVVLEFKVKNESYKNLSVELLGWLQNMANFQMANKTKGVHKNTVINADNHLQMLFSSEVEDKDLPDYGNMSLTLENGTNAWYQLQAPRDLTYNFPEIRASKKETKEVKTPLGKTLTGLLAKPLDLASGEVKTVRFVLSWYFPNLHRPESGFHHLKHREQLRWYYSKKFKSSAEVANKILGNTEKYLTTTKDWNKTWYNATLPKWFLDRTFANVSTLATTSCYRLHDLTGDQDNEGRFYTMEGVYLGHGTCTHVFHYEQALGRVFPHLARRLRTQIDYGYSFTDEGIVRYRSSEYKGMGQQDGRDYAVDGHAGTIMRAYREHTTAPDKEYLNKFWTKIKKSIQYLIDHDKEKTGSADGILEGIQYNTLDRMWYGKIAWISGLYNAALLAGEAMAKEMDDKDFAKECRRIANLGKENISKELFNGEYFTQKLDPENLHAPNTNEGCHLDQLLGAYWANQVGLDQVFDSKEIKSALQAIYKYNLKKNYKQHLKTSKIPVSRFYASENEPLLISASFPKGGEEKAPGKIKNDWEKLVVGYFSEPWTGLEHHTAASFIANGMVEEGLEVVAAVHQRYLPSKRNPYNEIEYGNHYTRAMSGYAPFIAASGFTLHEPKASIGFAPKINPQKFKSAFITGQAWGTFTQEVKATEQINTLSILYGTLNLQNIKLMLENKTSSYSLKLNSKSVKVKTSTSDGILSLNFAKLKLKKGDVLVVNAAN